MGTRANDIASLIRTGTQLDSDAIGAGAITAPKLNVGQLGGRRNLIINGAMQVAQRGTSESGVTSTGYYTVDRMVVVPSAGLGTWTVSQDTDAPTEQGFSNSMKLACTATGTLGTSNALIIKHYLEGQNLQHIKKGTSNAESLTASFWVKTNKTGTYVVELRDADNNRTISKTFTVDAAGTWEKKTLTFAGDTTGTLDNDNARSFDFNIWLTAGTDYTTGTLQTAWGTLTNTDRAVGHNVNLADSTSNYFQITGVQLEVGETATPFEHRSFGEELALCQRYFQKSYDYDVAIGASDYNGAVYSRLNDPVIHRMDAGTRFSTPFRATPDVTVYSTVGTVDNVSDLLTLTTHDDNVGVGSLKHVGQTGIGGITLSVATDDTIGYHYTADAEL